MTLRRNLVVFVKAPRRGQVKTRLARGIGPGPATAFYRNQTAALLRRLRRDRRWRLLLAITPDRDLRAGFWPAGVPRMAQGPGDLGRRMARPCKRLPPGPVVIVGTDIPELGPGDLAAAFRALGAHDAVFGPAEDGGYWLVGLRRRPATPDLFRNVRWSAPTTLAETLANLQGRRAALLRRLADVDTVEDWRAWRERQLARRRSCSLSRGSSSTKLQGLKR